MTESPRPALLVLASTYPRWRNDPEPGFVHELNKRLAARFDVTALVPDAPDADPNGVFEGVNVVRYRYAPRLWQTLVHNGGIAANLKRSPWKWLLLPGFLLCQYLAARRIVRRRHIDVVHAHWLIPQGMIALGLKRSFRLPYIVTSHGGDLFGLRSKVAILLKRCVAASCATMTVVSNAMRTEAKHIGIHPPALQVIPMGVDLGTLFVTNGIVQRDSDRLLFVGRLVPKKGLAHLLEAMPRIAEQRPEVVLDIVGFGPEEDALKAQVVELGLEQRVNFLGAMPQGALPDLYRRASVFVAPFVRDESGDQEGLPVVLMEAIGCGCPVVVGNVPGVQDLLGAIHTEVSFDPRDPAALTQAIVDVLKQPELAVCKAESIRRAVARSIDWCVIAERYADILEDCIQR